MDFGLFEDLLAQARAKGYLSGGFPQVGVEALDRRQPQGRASEGRSA